VLDRRPLPCAEVSSHRRQSDIYRVIDHVRFKPTPSSTLAFNPGKNPIAWRSPRQQTSEEGAPSREQLSSWRNQKVTEAKSVGKVQENSPSRVRFELPSRKNVSAQLHPA
jgi:hypothetical protein